MNKRLFLSTIIAMTAQCAFATDPFSAEPAPAQSLHTVQSSASPTVTQQPAAAPASASVVSSPALESGAAIINTGSSQSTMAMNDNDPATRIQNLIATNQAMASSIRAINQNVSVLQQQVMELESPHNNQVSDWFVQLMQNQDVIGLLSFGGVALLLLSIGVFIGRKVVQKAESVAVMSQKRVRADVLDDDTKTEYDFMSSDEAIPAKLDLARAYIAMNDEEQARMVLTAVIEKGNQEQRSEALSLIQAMLNKK